MDKRIVRMTIVPGKMLFRGATLSHAYDDGKGGSKKSGTMVVIR